MRLDLGKLAKGGKMRVAEAAKASSKTFPRAPRQGQATEGEEVKQKLAPIAPRTSPTDGGYESISCRPIANGFVVSQYGPGGSVETYHESKPSLSAQNAAERRSGQSSLAKAVKVAQNR